MLWRWRHRDHVCWFASTKQHSTTFQRTVICTVYYSIHAIQQHVRLKYFLEMRIYKFLTELLASTSSVAQWWTRVSISCHLHHTTVWMMALEEQNYVTMPCFISENSPHHSFLNMSRGPYEGMYMYGSIHQIQKVSKFALTCGLHCWKGWEAHVFIKLWL